MSDERKSAILIREILYDLVPHASVDFLVLHFLLFYSITQRRKQSLFKFRVKNRPHHRPIDCWIRKSVSVSENIAETSEALCNLEELGVLLQQRTAFFQIEIFGDSA